MKPNILTSIKTKKKQTCLVYIRALTDIGQQIMLLYLMIKIYIYKTIVLVMLIISLFVSTSECMLCWFVIYEYHPFFVSASG